MLFEGVGAVDRDPVAVTLDCEAQRGLQSVLVRTPRDFQLVPVIAHGRRADAIDDRALLGDAVLLWKALRGLLTDIAGHGVALETLGRITGAQRA